MSRCTDRHYQPNPPSGFPRSPKGQSYFPKVTFLLNCILESSGFPHRTQRRLCCRLSLPPRHSRTRHRHKFSSRASYHLDHTSIPGDFLSPIHTQHRRRLSHCCDCRSLRPKRNRSHPACRNYSPRV